MLKKTLLFSKKCSLTTKHEQLVVQSEARNATIPIEDIGFVVLENHESYISLPAMDKLVQNNVAVIFCNRQHLPNAMLLNLDGHHRQQEHFKNQINASEPLKKQLWQQTVKQKIKNQGILMEKTTGKTNHFAFLESKVLSGDTSNMEAVAPVTTGSICLKTILSARATARTPIIS